MVLLLASHGLSVGGRRRAVIFRARIAAVGSGCLAVIECDRIAVFFGHCLAVINCDRLAVVGGRCLAVIVRDHIFAVVGGPCLAATRCDRTAVVGGPCLAITECDRIAVVGGPCLAVIECGRTAVVGGHSMGSGVRGAGAISLLYLGIALVAHAHVSTLCRGHPRDGHHQCHHGCRRQQHHYAPHKALPPRPCNPRWVASDHERLRSPVTC